jgi:hypothetical protein
LSGILQPEENFDSNKCAENEDFTMSKVDKFQDTVHHGIAESDQSVHESQDETLQQHLRKNFQR